MRRQKRQNNEKESNESYRINESRNARLEVYTKTIRVVQTRAEEERKITFNDLVAEMCPQAAKIIDYLAQLLQQ